MDGQAQADGNLGMSAPENRQGAAKAAQAAKRTRKKCAEQAKRRSIAPSEKCTPYSTH